MRWLFFALLALAAVIAQTTAAPRLAVFGARPDVLLVVVVYLSLHARGQDAGFAAWTLGLLADLFTVERMGLLALSYLMASVVVLAVRELLFRDRLSTLVLLTAATGLLLRGGWILYRLLLYGTMGLSVGGALREMVLGALWSAAWAGPLGLLLRRGHRLLGLPRPRYSYAGLTRMNPSHV